MKRTAWMTPLGIVSLVLLTPAAAFAADGTAPHAGGLAAFLHEHVPGALRQVGPFELLWWQWLALAVVAALAACVAFLLQRATLAILRRLAHRTRPGWDDALVTRLRGPVWLAWTIGAASFGVPWLELRPGADAWLGNILDTLQLVPTFWALYRGMDVVRDVIEASERVHGRPDVRTILRLLTRVAKAFVLAIAVVTTLAALGYPIAGLLGGLGLGAVALALAAQKTIENLFGSVSLSLDQPIRVGDFVRVQDVTGTVESIGLRSTRIRTLDRTLVTIPNGQLSEMRLESYSVRDRIQLACTVGLTYGTTARQLRDVLDGLEQVLRRHPKIWPDALVVRLQELGSFALQIEIRAWFQTTDWAEFQLIRQDVLLQFLDVVERAGSQLAFPTRTVHLAPGSRTPAPAAA